MTAWLAMAISATALAQEGQPSLNTAEADFVCTAPGGLLGVPPMDVTCEVLLSDLYTYDRALWLFGDGAQGEGDRVTHTYDVAGQFGVRLDLEGLRFAIDDTGPEPVVEPVAQKYGYITACGPAEPEFTVEKRNGLRYEVINRSQFIPDCVEDVTWTVYRGEARTGEPVVDFDGWEPVLDLPEEGIYTIFLDIRGLGGDTAARLTVDAVNGVDEKLQGFPTYCATSPAAMAGWWLPLALLWRRRR